MLLHTNADALWRAPFLEFWIPVLNRASCKGLATLANCGINRDKNQQNQQNYEAVQP